MTEFRTVDEPRAAPDRDGRRAELGRQLRIDAIRAADAAGSGHPTSAMSSADLMAVLLDGYLRYDFDDPAHKGNDRLVFSKGHACLLLYAMFLAAGAITDRELLTFRKAGSRLQGHPTPALPWVDVATGSLGQGLPIGVGMALCARRLEHVPFRVWVLCGDSEMAEGSMWEAFDEAAHSMLGNLTAIIDVNSLGQGGATAHGWDLEIFASRARAFGWRALCIDGHRVDQVAAAYDLALADDGQPTVIVAKTHKGSGVTAVEDLAGAHGRPLPDAAAAIAELGGRRHMRVAVAPPIVLPDRPPGPNGDRRDAPVPWPAYLPGASIATRQAYGEALAAAGSDEPRLVALDADAGSATYADVFAAAHPDRFFDMRVAEQQLVSTAVGMQVLGWRPFASTFAAFLSRGHDFVRMAAVSGADLTFCGSHAGVSVGEDGPSQMGLEDLAMMRAVHGSVVLYPCDANQTAALVRELVPRRGIGYLRTTRGPTPVLYRPDEDFAIGGSRTLRSSDDDQVTVATAGITVHEALAAAERLAAEGIGVRVVDTYSVKPLDVDGLAAAVDATRGRLVTVEDHRPEGGLGDAIAAALSSRGTRFARVALAVCTLPGSATPTEQLAAAGIDADHIEAACRRLLA